MIDVLKYSLTIFFLDQVTSAVLKNSKAKWRKKIILALIIVILSVSFEVLVNRIPQNYYQTFSVDRIFSTDTLKKNFRKLSLIYHPDRATEDSSITEEKFQDLRFQYDMLLNENTRLIYDLFGPDVTNLFKDAKESKQIDYEQLFQTLRNGSLTKDGIFYFVFGVLFIAMSSDQSLITCRKLCYILVIAFYALELNFLFSPAPSFDLFDYFLPKYAIWQRIYFCKYMIGVVCVILKAIFLSKIVKPEHHIIEKLKRIKQLQEKINIQTEVTDSGETRKIANQDSNYKQNLLEINHLLEETAKICEENSPEKKKQIKIQKKKKIKTSILLVLVFIWGYSFFNFH